MTREYRYHRPSARLEFYTLPEMQGSPPPPGEQPPYVRDYILISRNESMQFARDEPDIRGFAVNTPNGDTIGEIDCFLADNAHDTIPYAYVKIEGEKTVVVPTNQFSIYPDLRIVTLEGGKTALFNAPPARFVESDAEQADRYWGDYRRRNAA